MKLFGLALLLLMQQQQCDIVGDKAKSSAETALRDYFPRVTATLVPNQSRIEALTCSTGVGVKLIEQLPPIVFQNPDYVSAQKMLPLGNLASLLGGLLRGRQANIYQYWDIGFEQGAWRFDIMANRAQWIAPDAEYQQKYRQVCSPPPQSANVLGADPISTYADTLAGLVVSPNSPPTQKYIWLPAVRIQLAFANGATQTMRSIETLGVYSAEEFQKVGYAETTLRLAIIERAMRRIAESHGSVLRDLRVEVEKLNRVELPVELNIPTQP